MGDRIVVHTAPSPGTELNTDLGSTFSGRVQDLIESEAARRAQESDIEQDEARSEVESELQDAAGITNSPFRRVLNGEVQCPFVNLGDPHSVFREWETILGADDGTLQEAAESDGCSYGQDDNRAPRSSATILSSASADDTTSDSEAPSDLRAAADRDSIDLGTRQGRVTELDATEQDVRVINERFDLNLSLDEVMMFRDFAASTGPMREKRLRFTRGALQRFADLMGRGRPYVLHHNPDRYVGSTLRAEVVEDTEVRGVEADWLAVDWFAIRRNATEQRQQDLMDVRTGLQYTSIRFSGGDREMMAEEVGDEEVRFLLIDDNPSGADQHDRLDVMHVSRVELGAIKGAGATTQ